MIKKYLRMKNKNGNYAFHNAQLPHRTYIEMKKLFLECWVVKGFIALKSNRKDIELARFIQENALLFSTRFENLILQSGYLRFATEMPPSVIIIFLFL